MKTHVTFDELSHHYPCVQNLARDASALMGETSCAVVKVPAGTVLFDEGAPCAGFPMVLEGTISVARHSVSGRSLELYRVAAGEICVVSAAALFRHSALNARAVAVTPVSLVMVSPGLFAAWTSVAAFRDFVFGIFAQRLTDLMYLVDAVAFQRLDRRLADHLLGHGETVHTTHQRLADELGTVREIVTRVLKRFEDAGLVRLARERIDVLDPGRLRALAAGALDPL